MDDFTRREFLVAAGLIALVPGCGSGEESGEGGEGTSGETRTIEHAGGSTEVPVDLRRIVVMDAGYATDLAVLGAPVVGTILPSSAGSTQVERYLADTERVGTSDEPNLEAIAALRPDLIVARGIEGSPDPLYEQLAQIAPTVAAEFIFLDWRENFRTVAAVVGREADARQRLEEIDATLAEIRSSLPKPGPTANYVRVTGDGIITGEPLSARLLDEAGFEPGLPFDEEMVLSAERLPDADADVLLVGGDPGAGGEALRELQRNPLWERLDVARRDAVLEVDTAVWQCFAYTDHLAALPDLRRAAELARST